MRAESRVVNAPRSPGVSPWQGGRRRRRLTVSDFPNEVTVKSRIAITLGLIALVSSTLLAHDLFLRLASYFVEPGAAIEILVLNGSFAQSENAVTADRVFDISLVTPAMTERLDTTAWRVRGDSTWLGLRVGEAGTYVVGAAILPREITLEAEDFNSYLEHDGIPDILALRAERGELDRPATERYSKHVKAVFQVGTERSAGFSTVLGYPAEIVPLTNPYELSVGSELRVRCLVDRHPVGDQTVVWGGEGPDGPLPERRARTDQDGVASVMIDVPGKWYVKFINMVAAHEPDLDYVSRWATLTFEAR